MAATSLKLGVPSNPFEDVFSTGRESSRPSMMRGEQSITNRPLGSYEQTIFTQLEVEPHKNFTQACPPDQFKQTEKCTICSEGFSSLLKKPKNCQFCGKCVCKECSRHSRRDPKNEEVTLRVCDLCHQQILYKRIIEAFMVKKQNIDVLRHDITEECNQKKNELHKKQITNEEVNLQMQNQRHKYERVLEDRRLKVGAQKERYNKGLVEGSTLKNKIQKLNEVSEAQEEELSNISASLYECVEKKAFLESALRKKEIEQERIQQKYQKIAKDIDMGKLQQQEKHEISTDATEDLQTKSSDQKKKEQLKFVSTIIHSQDVNMSLNFNANASLGMQRKMKPIQKKPKDKKVSGEGCCRSDSRCSIY